MANQSSTIETLLLELDDKENMYVFERSKVASDTEGFKNAGLSKGWWFGKSQEIRDRMNEIAVKLRVDRTLIAQRKLASALEEAIDVKIEGLKYSDKRLRQASSTEIIDRNLGKPTQRVESKNENKDTITVDVIDDESTD